MTASMELYRYTLTLRNGDIITTDAMSYREAEPWLVFDDTVSTVLTIRAEAIDRIARSPLPIGSQRVDELTDTEPGD